jgi:hypothetical protein
MAVLLAPVWARPGAAFFNHGDMYSYHAPLRALTASSLQSGRIPFWNPFILLGVPHFANPQVALFYPPALLEAFFPVVKALMVDEIFHLLLAGIGVFLLARHQRLDRTGAFILASAYSLCPFLVYRITAGIPTLLAALAWVPWLWLAWLSDFPGLLAAALALQLLSGHGQFLVVNAAAMTVWGLLRDGRGVLARRLAAAAAAALALTAVQWASTAEFLAHSVRANWSGAMSGAYALPDGAIWTWLNPGALGTPLDESWSDVISVFYETCGGWLGPFALALAAWGLVRGRRRAGAGALAAAGFFLALGPHGPVSRALLGFSVLSYLRTPSRWLFLSVWGVLLLAGAGWAALKSRKFPIGVRTAAALAAFLPLAVWDASYLRAQDAAPFMAARPEIVEFLAGRPSRVLTDPELANPNKTILYRMMNVNGYEAFYPRGVPGWAAAAEGAPAADASRVYVTRWLSDACRRAGVIARLSAGGIERGAGWPLSVFIDGAGRRLLPDPHLWIERPERWRISGPIPPGAAALTMASPAYPGWTARSSGVETAVDLWDGVFTALPLDAAVRQTGVLDVTLNFQPTAWGPLLALTIGAWLVWLSALGARARAT